MFSCKNSAKNRHVPVLSTKREHLEPVTPFALADLPELNNIAQHALRLRHLDSKKKLCFFDTKTNEKKNRRA